MKRLTSNIKVGSYLFKGLVDLKIESTWEQLTDTCIITIPRKLEWNGKTLAVGVDPLFDRGDKVVIELGYDGNNVLEFTGYVRDIEVATPVTITCEDSAFLLKQSSKTVSFENVSLSDLLTEILPKEIDFEALGVNLGQFRLRNATPAKVLHELKENYSLYSFFKGEKLFVGFAYPPSRTIDTLNFEFERNVISDKLDYRKEQDVKIKVKAISMLPDNKKLEIEEGDPDGDVRTFHYYDVKEADLRKMAKEEISRLRYSGWDGSFLAFGQPFVKHGDIVALKDNKLDRQGDYLVKKVITTFGLSGYRREIFLDRKA